jgi:hypothetical protein
MVGQSVSQVSEKVELQQKFSFSYFRENFRFSHQNMTKSRKNNGKFIKKKVAKKGSNMF